MKAMDELMLAAKVCFVFINPIAALKVLLIPVPIHSHCNQMGMIGEALAKRGHSVTAYLPDHWDSERCVGGRSIDVIHYKTSKDEVERMRTGDVNVRKSSILGWVETIRKCESQFCRPILRDNTSIEMVKDIKFDMAVVDAFPGSRCYMLIPYCLQIPFVSLSLFLSWFDTDSPFISNIEPYLYVDYRDDMTFPQRLINTLVTIASPFLTPWPLHTKCAPELSFFEYMSLIRQSELFLQDDDVILSGALPAMPNTIQTGGFTPRDPEPLQPELDEFYASATDGVIVVSFGSTGVNTPPDIHNLFVEVFTNLSQKILWNAEINVSYANIRTIKWIPQNDVLGHRNTKLFISHCGRSSFYETVYHAVPTICIPLFADQPSNARKLHEKKIGVRLDPDTITTPLLKATIRRLLTEPEFKENVKFLSAMYKNIHPVSAAEVSADAIEHVMKYGSNHLRPQSLSLAIPAVLMVDVWFVILMVLCCMLVILFRCCVRLIRLCATFKQKKED